ASAIYHLTKASPETIMWLRRFDHAAIYMMIAGTYTPFLYNVMDDDRRWLLLVVIWVAAIAGAIYKLLFLREGGFLSLVCYVATACLGVFVLPQAFAILPPSATALIIAGCVFYVIGVFVFGLEKPNFHPYFGHHELWHMLVLIGTAFHFAVILRYIV